MNRAARAVARAGSGAGRGGCTVRALDAAPHLAQTSMRAMLRIEKGGSLAKLIVLVAVFAAAWWLLKRYVRSLRKDAPSAAVTEDMVRCAHCGVHLPRSESLARDGRQYCSEEHSRRGG
jgi:uncharacterized protein